MALLAAVLLSDIADWIKAPLAVVTVSTVIVGALCVMNVVAMARQPTRRSDVQQPSTATSHTEHDSSEPQQHA